MKIYEKSLIHGESRPTLLIHASISIALIIDLYSITCPAAKVGIVNHAEPKLRIVKVAPLARKIGERRGELRPARKSTFQQ